MVRTFNVANAIKCLLLVDGLEIDAKIITRQRKMMEKHFELLGINIKTKKIMLKQ
jgi:hypothetical protein